MKSLTHTLRITALIMLSVFTLNAVALETAQIKKPERATAKPDLIVYYINSYYPELDKVKVTVRNNGSAKSASNVLMVKVGRMVGYASIPALEPNHAYEPEVKFQKPLMKGMKMTAYVDAKKHVLESNESNNSKTHTY